MSIATNIEAEQQVLGSMLLDSGRISIVSAAGGADLFSDPVHAEIYTQAKERDAAGTSATVAGLQQWAAAHEGMKEIGGAKYLVDLAGASLSSSMIGEYCDILSDLKAKRDILNATQRAANMIEEGSATANEVAGAIEADLINVQPSNKVAPVSMLKAVTGALGQIEEAQSGDGAAFVKSGFPALDNIVSSFNGGELILLGGRPSMGKTAVALSMALNVARAGHGVVICSLEMTPESMALRALSEGTGNMRRGVNYSDMRKGGLDDRQMDAIIQSAQNTGRLPIQFLPREYSDVGALMAGAKQAKRMLGDNMRFFIVDYAQLLTAKGASRYEEITKISLALKRLALTLNIPVMALSQLSRKVEDRQPPIPMLSDLRESGQLEQDADTVMFCYRPEYYIERNEPNDEDRAAWEELRAKHRGELQVIVAKQRQGMIGNAVMSCNPALNLIWER